jgi:hypothetical protein
MPENGRRSGAKPVRIGIYDRPPGAGRHRRLYVALAVIVAALIAWLLFAHRGAAAATPASPLLSQGGGTRLLQEDRAGAHFHCRK